MGEPRLGVELALAENLLAFRGECGSWLARSISSPVLGAPSHGWDPWALPWDLPPHPAPSPQRFSISLLCLTPESPCTLLGFTRAIVYLDWFLPAIVFFLTSPGRKQVNMQVLEERYSYLKCKILHPSWGCCDLQRVFPSLVGAHATEWEDLEGTK